jgi:hypothetical protein
MEAKRAQFGEHAGCVLARDIAEDDVAVGFMRRAAQMHKAYDRRGAVEEVQYGLGAGGWSDEAEVDH